MLAMSAESLQTRDTVLILLGSRYGKLCTNAFNPNPRFFSWDLGNGSNRYLLSLLTAAGPYNPMRIGLGISSRPSLINQNITARY